MNDNNRLLCVILLGSIDNTDKSDPIREHECIWCMACVTVCPPKAIKVEQSNLEFHQRASQTYQ